MQQIQNKLDTILVFDGIAIFFIVLYHELQAASYGQTDYVLSSLIPYLVALGMSLFTFSSGYKLMVNHSNQLAMRTFIGTYYIKRFVRLYKPYLGYTLLSVFPLLLVSYAALYVFHLDYSGITIFTTLNNFNIYNFLLFFVGKIQLRLNFGIWLHLL